jgi:hypothetical protein
MFLIAGDAAHNVRTALDHLAVAVAPADREQKASFPIVLDDPASNHEARSSFDRAVKGMPAEAIDVIEGYQPYKIPAKELVRTHALAIIRELDNTDKHRQLVGIISGLTGVVVRTFVRGLLLPVEPHPPLGLVEDGTDLSHFEWRDPPPLQESEVQVEVDGTPVITVDVGLSGGQVELTSLRAGIAYLRNHLIPELEPFVRR